MTSRRSWARLYTWDRSGERTVIPFLLQAGSVADADSLTLVRIARVIGGSSAKQLTEYVRYARGILAGEKEPTIVEDEMAAAVTVDRDVTTVALPGGGRSQVATKLYCDFLDAWAAAVLDEIPVTPIVRPDDTGSARTDLRRLCLRHEHRDEYRLADGSLTPDRAAAWADPPRADPAARSVGEAVGAALLRLAPTAPGPPTPGRLTWLWRIAAAGLLPDEIAVQLQTAGRIDDAEWAQLRRLLEFVPLEAVQVSYWHLTLDDGTDEVEPPCASGLLGRGGPEPPESALLAVIHMLSAAGWKLDSVSSGGLDENERLDDEDWRLEGLDREYLFRRTTE